MPSRSRSQLFDSLFDKETMRKMFPHRDAALRAYLRDIGGLPRLLSANEERQLLVSAVKGDTHAQRLLVEANLRMVLVISARFQGRGLPLMDLIQEGNLGLYDAIQKFDLTKKNRYGTYAKFYIFKRLVLAVAERAPLIRTPYDAVQSMQKIGKAVSEFIDQGANPTSDMIAQRIGLPVEQVAELLVVMQEPLSLDLSGDDYDPLSEVIAAPPLLLLDAVSSPSLLSDVSQMMSKVLTEAERQVIELRFGLTEEGIVYDYHEIAKKVYHRTHPRADERIKQLERSALGKLRGAFDEEKTEG
jgi:RNA polymerase primary sigma factor